MRYLIECAFNGAGYHGWQAQTATEQTVQHTLQQAFSTILHRDHIEVIGCGRTDAGVHARQYFAHFDFEGKLPEDIDYHLNAILPPDIAVSEVRLTLDNFHARYDACLRTYEYLIHADKSPFINDLSYHFKFFNSLELSKLQRAADMLLSYESFFPFCLSGSNLKNYKVQLNRVTWEAPEPGKLKFSISANRFLRGMVRLVVGMCINLALDKLTKEQVIRALDDQTLLPKSLSVPAHGLYLTAVKYP